MSVLFPKVNKPREWDYRPIYYDPKKDEREQRRSRMQFEREQSKKDGVEATDEGKHVSGLHRGSFREARQFETGQKYKRVSRLTFWVALFLILIFVFFFVL
mgnify:FL=1